MNISKLVGKESNRLELIRYNLNQCGVFCEIKGDDLFIDPTKNTDPRNNQIRTDRDHRIAMSFAVMGMKLDINLKIINSEFIKTSFPNFTKTLNLIGGNLTE